MRAELAERLLFITSACTLVMKISVSDINGKDEVEDEDTGVADDNDEVMF